MSRDARRLPHALASIMVGGLLGFVFYAVQGPPTFDPVVIANAFAQVLVVSAAEILVCWALVEEQNNLPDNHPDKYYRTVKPVVVNDEVGAAALVFTVIAYLIVK